MIVNPLNIVGQGCELDSYTVTPQRHYPLVATESALIGQAECQTVSGGKQIMFQWPFQLIYK
jgi:hypothetical protein